MSMKIDPLPLAHHLERLRMPGLIERAAVRGRFQADAIGARDCMLVSIPPLEHVEELPTAIGVNLKILIGTLRDLHVVAKKAGLGAAEVEITVEGNRLVLSATELKQVTRLMIFRPETASYIAPDTAEELLPKGDGQLLLGWNEWTGKFLDDVKTIGNLERVIKTLKGKTVELSVGPDRDDGAFTVPSMGERAIATIPHSLTAPKPYTLTFAAGPFVAILAALSKPAALPHLPPRLFLQGPKNSVLFSTDDDYRYLLLPQSVVWKEAKKISEHLE